MKSRYKGIMFIVCSAFCFALMNLFVRLSGDLPSIQKSFFRNLVAFFFALILMKRDHVGFSGKKENLWQLILRSTFGTIGILCNFYAVDHLVLADASMLNKMSPFFAILFSFLILKEKVKPAQAVIVAGAFAGSLFIIKPSPLNMELVPALIGLLGGMSAGAAYTFVRSLGIRGEKGPFIVCFFSGFSCLVTLPYLLVLSLVGLHRLDLPGQIDPLNLSHGKFRAKGFRLSSHLFRQLGAVRLLHAGIIDDLRCNGDLSSHFLLFQDEDPVFCPRRVEGGR